MLLLFVVFIRNNHIIGIFVIIFCMKYEKLNLDPTLDGKIWLMRKKHSPNYEPHIHRELEFNFVLSGQAEYIVKGIKFKLSPNTLIWLFPNQKHVLINASENFQMYIGVFKPNLLKHLVNKGAEKTLITLDYLENIPKIVNAEDASSLIQSFEEIINIKNDAAYYNSYLATLCLKVWYIFKNTETNSISKKIPLVVEKCLHLFQNPQNNYTLEAISEKLGYSPSQLSRLFKKHTGTSIVDFRNQKRLEFVAIQMNAEKTAITKAAYAAGFGSYAQFHRIFKKYFGYSPNEYIKKLKQ